MPSRSTYVKELMAEFGVSGSQISKKIERTVSEVALDMLLQAGARFRRLRKREDITMAVGESSIRVPSNFHTVYQLIQVDSDGDFVAKLDVLDDTEYYARKADSDFSGSAYCYLELRDSPSPGEYLVFNGEFTETTYYRLFYFRTPTPNDVDVIENPRILKYGVRAEYSQYYPDTRKAIGIYEQWKSSVRPSKSRINTGMVLKPSLPTARTNRLMKKIGRGR